MLLMELHRHRSLTTTVLTMGEHQNWNFHGAKEWGDLIWWIMLSFLTYLGIILPYIFTRVCLSCLVDEELSVYKHINDFFRCSKLSFFICNHHAQGAFVNTMHTVFIATTLPSVPVFSELARLWCDQMPSWVTGWTDWEWLDCQPL